MSSAEGLKEYLRHLLIINHGSFSPADHPVTMADARALGMDAGALSLLIQEIHASLNWEPLARVDNQLEPIIFRGILTKEEAESIIESVADKLDTKTATGYIVSEIKKKGFAPKEKIHADPESFMNSWMTEQAWQENRITVEWLDEKAGSLAKIGEISFRKKEAAQYFLRHASYLVGVVTVLTKSVSKANEFELLIESEKDPELRYLRIIYRLNPSLAFRFRGGMYYAVPELLDAACETAESFNAILDLFNNHYLNIWLEETNPPMAKVLSGDKAYTRFLYFIYSSNEKYPYYLQGFKIAEAEDLVSVAFANKPLWLPIAEHIEKLYLPVWFECTGKKHINLDHKTRYQAIRESGLYQEEELEMASVQSLLLALDPAMPEPGFQANVTALSFPDLEGKDVLEVPVTFRIENRGYFKMKLELSDQVPGIGIDAQELVFDSMDSSRQTHVVTISIDTLQLVKDKVYSLSLVASTVYGSLEIPLEFRAVFPKRAFTIKLVQYAAIFACYFGLFRYVLGLVLNDHQWLINVPFLVNDSPLWFFAFFALFAAGNFYALKWIRKFEKI